MVDFKNFWQSITGHEPFPYQERFVTGVELPQQLNVITGAGKTATAVLGWLWRRKINPEVTPRRLVYCLPMRTLVEQTYRDVKNWLNKAGLNKSVELHLLMGGAISKRWEINPEKDCILIGTQDLLLSRALNRGYGMSRYRWSIDFALLNNDCLWVMDEVQLMGAGLRTTAQLQGFRKEFTTYGNSLSLWMSATLNADLLKTVNFQPVKNRMLTLDDEDRENQRLKRRLEAKKRLIKANTVIQGDDKQYARTLAKEVASVHLANTLTIVICNRVNRAQAVFSELENLGQNKLLLVHSQFRVSERQKINNKLHEFTEGIIVGTQAIEAGANISARVMITELAPWSSLVQRFGRCNRYGEYDNEDSAIIYWVDIDLNQKKPEKSDLKEAGGRGSRRLGLLNQKKQEKCDLNQEKLERPYDIETLEEARSLLVNLIDVSPASLSKVKAKTPSIQGLIPRKKDLLQLFDTSTDLAGHDIDVSSFIRSTGDSDVAIAWRDWLINEPNTEDVLALHQDELCRVSLWLAKNFLPQLTKSAEEYQSLLVG